MRGDDIIIGTEDPFHVHLSKLAFSHGIVRSTQLAVLENHLAQYLHSTQHLPSYMRQHGTPPSSLSAKEVLRMQGELMEIRGVLNLQSELVDAYPDFYWTQSDLAR